MICETAEPSFFRSIRPPVKNKSPPALPSIVIKVLSAPPSVPLNMMSVSLPCASIVMLPAEVAILTAASPVVKSSYAVDMPS